MARKLKEIEKDNAADPYLIFITTYSEMMPPTYQFKLEALDFICKDIIEGVGHRVRECLKIIDKESRTKREKINYLIFHIGK